MNFAGIEPNNNELIESSNEKNKFRFIIEYVVILLHSNECKSIQSSRLHISPYCCTGLWIYCYSGRSYPGKPDGPGVVEVVNDTGGLISILQAFQTTVYTI